MRDFYKFTVRWQNEDYQPEVSEGIITGESFSDAVQQLAEHCFDNIESIQVEPIGESRSMLLFEELLEFFNYKSKEEEITSVIGPQLREALEDAIEAEREQRSVFNEIKEGLREAIEYERLENNSKA